MTLSKEHRANIEAAIKKTEYKYFGGYEFSEAQHDAVDLLVSVAQAMLDDDAQSASIADTAGAKPVPVDAAIPYHSFEKCAEEVWQELARKSLYYLEGNLPDGPTDQREFEKHKALLKAMYERSSVADAAAKFTERERFVWNLGYSAGTDRAANVAQKCMHGKTYEEHGRTNWNNGIAEAVDAIRALGPDAGSNSVADAAGASEIRALIADDAYAMSFQTMGQYRSALLKLIEGIRQ